MSTRLSTEELEQRRNKDFFLFLAASKRAGELEAERDAARRALRDLTAAIDSGYWDRVTAAAITARAVLPENPKGE